MISKKGYNGVQYAHQGWLTEDHKYFLTNDELDESREGTNTRTFVWDVQDLDNPTLIGTHEHADKAIDHNLYVVGNLAYESNCTNGLRVMDLINVAQGKLSELAFFDSYPASNITDFLGSWSNYPFFSSGTIIISDITGGLFVVKLNSTLAPTSDFTYKIDANKVSFTNTSLKGALYEWDFGDTSTPSNEENPIHEYEIGGNYDVKLITTNSIGSNETIQKVNIVYTGVNESNKFADLSIYPNPANDRLYINFGRSDNINAAVSITNLNGKIILEQLLQNSQDVMSIPTNNIPNGMYYLIINSNDEKIIKKVVIN